MQILLGDLPYMAVRIYTCTIAWALTGEWALAWAVSCPDPTPKGGKGVWWIWIVSLVWPAWRAADTAQILDLIGHAHGCTQGWQFKFMQQAMALCIPAVGESHDYTKAASEIISLERSNSFPWPKQIHQTLFPPSGCMGSGDEIVWDAVSLILTLHPWICSVFFCSINNLVWPHWRSLTHTHTGICTSGIKGLVHNIRIH